MLWDDRPYLPAAGARMMRVGVENIHTDVGKTAMAQVTRPSRTSFTPQHRGGGSRPVTAAWKRTVAAVDGGLQMLWRIRLGWLTGRALLVLTHVGRRTGKHYRTVLYVQRCDERTCEATVIVAWGDSRWFRNISAAHAAQVEIGLQRYAPDQRFLTTEEIVELEKSFRTRHRIIAWGQAKLMGWPWPATEEQLQNLCSGLRAVAFAPRSRGVGADTSATVEAARPTSEYLAPSGLIDSSSLAIKAQLDRLGLPTGSPAVTPSGSSTSCVTTYVSTSPRSCTAILRRCAAAWAGNHQEHPGHGVVQGSSVSPISA